MRAKRAGADANMLCLPLDPRNDELQMLPSKRRMELRAWCDKHKVNLLGKGETKTTKQTTQVKRNKPKHKRNVKARETFLAINKLCLEALFYWAIEY